MTEETIALNKESISKLISFASLASAKSPSLPPEIAKRVNIGTLRREEVLPLIQAIITYSKTHDSMSAADLNGIIDAYTQTALEKAEKARLSYGSLWQSNSAADFDNNQAEALKTFFQECFDATAEYSGWRVTVRTQGKGSLTDLVRNNPNVRQDLSEQELRPNEAQKFIDLIEQGAEAIKSKISENGYVALTEEIARLRQQSSWSHSVNSLVSNITENIRYMDGFEYDEKRAMRDMVLNARDAYVDKAVESYVSDSRRTYR